MLKVIAKRGLLPGAYEEYAALVKPLVDETRTEPGCIDYALYYDAAENTAVMIETWESQAHLEVHLQKLTASGYLEKMNAYSDPARPSVIEKYAYVY